MTNNSNNKLLLNEITVPNDEKDTFVEYFINSTLVPIFSHFTKIGISLPSSSSSHHLHMPKPRAGVRVSFFDSTKLKKLSICLRGSTDLFSSVEINPTTNKTCAKLKPAFVDFIALEAKKSIAQSCIPYKALSENHKYLVALTLAGDAYKYLSDLIEAADRLKRLNKEDKINIYCKVLLNIGLAFWQHSGKKLSPVQQLQIFMKAAQAVDLDERKILAAHTSKASKLFSSKAPSSFTALAAFKLKIAKDLMRFVDDKSVCSDCDGLIKIADDFLNTRTIESIGKCHLQLDGIFRIASDHFERVKRHRLSDGLKNIASKGSNAFKKGG